MTIKPLVWEQRDWKEPYSDNVVDSSWHAELPAYLPHYELYSIRDFGDGYHVFARTRLLNNDPIKTLDMAKLLAFADWTKFIHLTIDL